MQKKVFFRVQPSSTSTSSLSISVSLSSSCYASSVRHRQLNFSESLLFRLNPISSTQLNQGLSNCHFPLEFFIVNIISTSIGTASGSGWNAAAIVQPQSPTRWSGVGRLSRLTSHFRVLLTIHVDRVRVSRIIVSSMIIAHSKHSQPIYRPILRWVRPFFDTWPGSCRLGNGFSILIESSKVLFLIYRHIQTGEAKFLAFQFSQVPFGPFRGGPSQFKTTKRCVIVEERLKRTLIWVLSLITIKVA